MKRIILFVLSLLLLLLTACGNRVNNHNASTDYDGTMMADKNPYFLEQEMKHGDLIVRGTIDSIEKTHIRDSGIADTKVNLDYPVTPAIVKIDKVLYGERPASGKITMLQHGSASDPIDSVDFVKQGEEVILLLMKTVDGVYWPFNGPDGVWYVKDGIVTSKALKELMIPFNTRSVEEFEQIITTAAKNGHHKDPSERFADILGLLDDSNIVVLSQALRTMPVDYPNNIYAYKSQVVDSLVLLAEKRALDAISESMAKGSKLGKDISDEMDMRLKEIYNYLPNNMIGSSLGERIEGTIGYVIDNFDLDKTKEKYETINSTETALVNPLQTYEKDGVTVPKIEEVIPYLYALANEEFKRIYHTYIVDGELDYAEYFSDFSNILKEYNSLLTEDSQKIADGLVQSQ